MYDDIILFVKLINFGSFTKAAKHTGITQSTITRRLNSLESELKTRLLKRNTRMLELTVSGKALYDKFKDHEQSVMQMLAPIIYDNENELHGVLNICLPPAFAAYAIAPHLASFIQEHPKLTVNVYCHYVEIDMIKDNYHLALIPFFPRRQVYNAQLIHQSKLILCCSREYITRYGVFTSFADRESHRFISGISQEHLISQYTSFYTEDSNEEVQVLTPRHTATNNMLMVKIMIDSGEVIGALPEEYVKGELATGAIVRVLPDYHVGYTGYYLLRNLDESDLRYKKFATFLDCCISKL